MINSDPTTVYLRRMRRTTLAAKVIAGIILVVGALATGGYYLQYSHAQATLAPAQAAASAAQQQYSAASDAEATAAGNADAAKAAFQAQQNLELETTGTVGSDTTGVTDMVNARNVLAQAETTLSDAATRRDGTAAALNLTQAYVREAWAQLLVAGITSGVIILLAVLAAFAVSMANTKARAVVALASHSAATVQA